MESVKNLVLLFVLIIFFNTVFTLSLWVKNKYSQYRYLFFLWFSTMVSFLLQGLFQNSDLQIALSSSFMFFQALSLVYLMSYLVPIHIQYGRFVIVLLLSIPVSIGFSHVGMGFTAIALTCCFGCGISCDLLSYYCDTSSLVGSYFFWEMAHDNSYYYYASSY